jgi:hypothetical protein
VHGPRAHRSPVLTPVAHIEIASDGAGPWDIDGESLSVTFDGGKGVWTSNIDYLAGSVSLDVADGTFVDPTAATAQEIVDWLNADDAFFARGMALLNDDGEVVIRSRNKGDYFSVQLGSGGVTDAVFGGDTDAVGSGQFYARNDLIQHTDPSADVAGAAWTTGAVTFTLDDVADLQPGTYVASVEIADAGRISATNYRTPSVGKVTFQVGQADEELPIARGCDSCHQDENGTGFILDYSRHYKIFDDTAIDQCAGCHDYQAQSATGTSWGGAKPIAKRVHAVHMGADLNYPLATVDYSNGDPVAGRNWAIHFPQDVRNCEACHGDGTSGTWATEPNRLACSGCHDSDAASAHFNLMTWDPTPGDSWNGDEEESCVVCH